MTELAIRQDGSAALAVHDGGGVARLMEWAQSAEAAYRVSENLVRTSFVPEGFRGKPHEATAAILAGSEVGLSPMASLRSFDVIQGTAAPRAITLRAIVQSVGHEMWTVESTASRAIVEGRRRGSDKVERSVWTLDRAKQLKLTGKANWQNQPQAMLLARATSECARLIAADAILGLPHTVEELGDNQPEPTTVAQRQEPEPTQVRRVRRARPAPPPEPEPVAEEPDLPGEEEPAPKPEPEPLPVDPGEAITQPQMRKLQALLNYAGFRERESRLEFVSRFLERDVASSSDLTKAEAHALIDHLEQNVEPEGSEQ